MSQITPFDFEGHAVRVLDLNNEPWFVGADIARVLGIASASGITRMVDDEDKGSHEVETPGGSQRVTIVNESGMYTALMRSNNPKARPFRRWITTEVLPSIRKRGGYLTPEATEAALTDPDFIIRLATDLKEERAKRAELEAQAEETQRHLRLVEPKAAAFDRWMGSGAEYGIDIAAKALCAAGYMTGRNRLFEELAAIGWAYKDASGWHPYQAHGPEGTKRLAVRMFYYDDPDTGVARGKSTLKITAKGVADLATRHGLLLQTVADALESAA